MALYFFHLRDGEDILLDPEGVQLPDMAAVSLRALAAARSILSTETLEGRLPLDMNIDVEDAAGTVVHRLDFSDAIEILPPADTAELAARAELLR